MTPRPSSVRNRLSLKMLTCRRTGPGTIWLSEGWQLVVWRWSYLPHRQSHGEGWKQKKSWCDPSNWAGQKLASAERTNLAAPSSPSHWTLPSGQNVTERPAHLAQAQAPHSPSSASSQSWEVALGWADDFSCARGHGAGNLLWCGTGQPLCKAPSPATA